MDKNKIAELIAKKMMGDDLSLEEAAYLNLWLDESETNREEFEFLTHLNFNTKTTDLTSLQMEVLADIKSKSGHSLPKRKIILFSIAVAASIIMGFIGGLIWYSGNDAIDTSTIVYNEVNVPIGAKTQLTLSDGTRVWLNGGSKIKYPSTFQAKSREVQLNGEAYFDVTENKAVPFIVKTSTLQIKVLGTAFNVKSYPEDKTVETTLVRGLVEVRGIKKGKLTEPFLIKPNQRMTFNKELSSTQLKTDELAEGRQESVKKDIPAFEVKQVNTTPIISWKEESLVFDNLNMEEIAVTLERWFGTKIHIMNDDLKKYRYKGRFYHNETIYQVLEVIKVITPIRYEVRNYEIYIDLNHL
ncbi:MAG: FecR family protein [Bacteroidetes bacterium]|nr:FecR family protein [Bacteroidota bacterium]